MIRVSEKEGRKMLGLKGRNKYNAQTCEYNGAVYHSKAEARYAQILDQRKQVGEIQEFWRQQDIPLKVNGVTVCRMVCDFKLLHQDDSVEFVELKGAVTAVFKLKLKLLRALMPNLRYTVIPAKEI